MEHHPIPQQISSYEFRLVGSMTLKQFIKLASGLILAFVVYNSDFIFFIKWPLVIGFSGFGAALAFLPINEQPLEKWILIFFRSVYSPTLYIWQKQPQPLDFGDKDFYQPITTHQDEFVDTEEKELKLENFLETIGDKEERAEGEMRKTKGEEKKAEENMAEGRIPKAEGEEEKAEGRMLKDESEEKKDEPEFIYEFSQKPLTATADAEFGEIPRPKPSTTPNKIVGMVFDQEEKMIENAIIEIQDKNGNAVRALRTNRLGQFETATPLSNGEYLVTVEKEGYDFDILKLQVEGKVIEPLIIKAKHETRN